MRGTRQRSRDALATLGVQIVEMSVTLRLSCSSDAEQGGALHKCGSHTGSLARFKGLALRPGCALYSSPRWMGTGASDGRIGARSARPSAG